MVYAARSVVASRVNQNFPVTAGNPARAKDGNASGFAAKYTSIVRGGSSAMPPHGVVLRENTSGLLPRRNQYTVHSFTFPNG